MRKTASMICSLFLFLTAGVYGQSLIIGEHLYDRILETPHPYPASSTGKPEVVWSEHYEFPGANYIVFEFSVFDLAPGDWVEVRHPWGEQIHVYEGKGFKDKGGDFITKAVIGPEAVIELYSTHTVNDHYGYRIERVTRGFSDDELSRLYGGSRAICGTDDKLDAICYETSHPDVYEKSKAVARILMDGSALCTAWLVSCENHVMTNSHCSWDGDFDSQAKLDRMEFQFMYQTPECGSGTATVEYSFMSGTFLENEHYIDYTLIQAPSGEDPAATYGWVNIDDRLADIDEQMFIVGHPGGRPKEISLESTHPEDQSGLCEVYTLNADPCITGATAPEIGYYCDTEGGSSGSPVFSLDTLKAIALHHCAYCPNRGVRIQDVWNHNQAGPNPLPPCTLYNDIGQVKLDRDGYGCDDTITIAVSDGSLPGAGFQDVDIWSDTETTPETVTLVETPPDSGTFVGTLSTTVDPPVSGDAMLSVSEGDDITVLYIDADDGQGGTNIPRYDYAVVDCTPPVITNVIIHSVSAFSAVIAWETNEPCTSTVVYGLTEPPDQITSETDLTMTHHVVLSDLNQCADYIFYVMSADEAGNETEDDNGGSYFTFKTLQLMILMEETMDTDPGWTYENLWEWGPASGTGGNPPSGYTGTHIVGYNLIGDYQNSLPVAYMTTTPFDCSSASQAYLGFWRWLGVESATWDHASIEISNDGGTSWDVVWEHTGSTLQETEWSYQEYDITDWAAGYGDVRLRWGMGPSDSVYAYCGWNIDDVLVSYTAPCNVPLLVYGDHTIDDSAGNNDGWINGGETIAMTVTLNNVGLDATNVSGTLSTTNPNVTITSPTVTFPDIPQSGGGTSLDAFVFDVDPSAGDGEVIPFTLAWTSEENSGSTTFSEMVVAPSLIVYEYQIEEVSGGTFNGIWEPGETIDVHVTVKNTGAGTGYDISGVLSSDLPAYVTIETGTASWPDIPGGGSAVSEAPHFRVTAAPDTPDPSAVMFTVDFTAEGYTGQSEFTIECTFSNFVRRYHWNMDTDPQWTTEDQWAWGEPAGLGGDPSSGYTGTNVYGYNLMGTYTNYMPETNLTTGPIDCTGFQDVEVRFMRWLGIESSQYDHAYFRISNDGVNWTTIWSHTGSTFTDPDWQEIAYDISAVADNEPAVYLRWVMGTTDVSVVYCGWNIDDVEIWADIYEAPPTATPTLPPTATPAPPTHTPTPDCIHHGDVNFDGVISAADAQLAFMITLGMYSPTYEEECAADCNGDGVVSAADAQLIFLTALGSGNCVDPL